MVTDALDADGPATKRQKPSNSTQLQAVHGVHLPGSEAAIAAALALQGGQTAMTNSSQVPPPPQQQALQQTQLPQGMAPTSQR